MPAYVQVSQVGPGSVNVTVVLATVDVGSAVRFGKKTGAMYDFRKGPVYVDRRDLETMEGVKVVQQV